MAMAKQTEAHKQHQGSAAAPCPFPAAQKIIQKHAYVIQKRNNSYHIATHSHKNMTHVCKCVKNKHFHIMAMWNHVYYSANKHKAKAMHKYWSDVFHTPSGDMGEHGELLRKGFALSDATIADTFDTPVFIRFGVAKSSSEEKNRSKH